MVHGAIGGWLGQVCVILARESSLDMIYPDAGAEHARNTNRARSRLRLEW